MSVIEVENVSKKFLIHHQGKHTDSLKETITHHLKKWTIGLFSHTQDDTSLLNEEFWALQNVSFKIEEGDRVAFLGRNGAGKSTLLKILSRITQPTSGRLTIRGRISSMLEVGTGFHPDLTGRENIFLNGAMMGMEYVDIKKKFDEIVEFSEIEQFLDTPIKRYSSGMFTRLGFAVAAHLDSDIMIVDEVLAVGDAQFQEKCLKKMNELGSQNRTVLFVSHSVNSVLALCNKGIYLEKGQLQAFEPIDQCVNRYTKSCPVAGLKWMGNVGDEHIRFHEASLKPPKRDSDFFYHGEKTDLDIAFEVLKPRQDLMLGFTIFNSRNSPVAHSRLCDHATHHDLLNHQGKHALSFKLNLDLFHPGEYYVKLNSSLLNKKKILNDDVLLKFSIYSQQKNCTQEAGEEKEGISLGNEWKVVSS